MKTSGTIRQTKTAVRRFVASRPSPPRFASAERIACRVTDVHHSEPGFFFPVEPATLFCPLSKLAPLQRPFTSHGISLERMSRLGVRSDFHE